MKENNMTAAVAAAKSRKETVLSRRQIEGMIAEGRNILIFDGRVLKADAWMKFHPGGEKAIQHMVGKDATDEINAYASVICASPFVVLTVFRQAPFEGSP